MLKIEKWAKNKPLDIVTIVLQAFISLENALGLVLKRIKENDEILDISKTNIKAKDWLSFYRRRKHLDIWLLANFLTEFGLRPPKQPPPKQPTTSHESQIDPLQNFDKYPRVKKSVNNFIKDLVKDFFQLTVGIYKSITLDDSIDENDKLDIPEHLQKPEMLFFTKVFTPCFVIYGELPGFLMRKARLGDIVALDKLLRIDKTAINDPIIGEQFHLASLDKDKTKFQTMVRALEGSMQGKASSQKVKSIIAGFISVFSESLGHRLNSTDIRELFNAVAVDRGYDELIDHDLPDSDEALSQAILRERKILAPLFNHPYKS